MKKIYCKILIIIAIAFLVVSCQSVVTSNKVEQRVIFPSYFALYNETAQTLTATVTFQMDNESGEFIKLSSDSHIFYNQYAMKRMSDDEKPCFYFYEEREMGDCPDEVNFSYTNEEGTIFFNKLKIRKIQISDLNLCKTQDTPFNYKGAVIDEDETITMVLKNDKNHYELQPEVADNTLIMTASMLQDVKAGTYEAYMLRTTYSTSVKAMDRGGSAETGFHSKSYKITIQ